MIVHRPSTGRRPRGLLCALSVVVAGAFLSACAPGATSLQQAPGAAPAQATVAALATQNAQLATRLQALESATPPAAAPPAIPSPTPARPTAVPSLAATAIPPIAPPATATRTAAPTTVATATLTTTATPASGLAASPSVTPALTVTGPAPTPPPAPSPTATPPAQVSGGAANLRGGPGTVYPIVGVAQGGQALAPVGRDAAGDWLQVRWGSGTAWVLASLLSLNLDASTLPLVTDIPPTPATIALTATVPVVPQCDSVPTRGFGQVWGNHPDVAATLGCPETWLAPGEVSTVSSVQLFEHGVMIWLAADGSGDPVYALIRGHRLPTLR